MRIDYRGNMGRNWENSKEAMAIIWVTDDSKLEAMRSGSIFFIIMLLDPVRFANNLDTGCE